MAKFKTLDDVEVKGKIVLVRVDFNAPVDPDSKKVLDDTRIRDHGETTIKELSKNGAKVVILAHQGRSGSYDFISLNQHAVLLSKVLRKPVKYVDDLYGEVAKTALKELNNGEIIILKNTRTSKFEQKSKSSEEHAKSPFIKELASVADIFVNDAFSVAHRAHASVVGFSAVLPIVAGRIMERELNALCRVLIPEKPCVFILGGAKADDSLDISRYVLKNDIADYILTGGVTAHLFLFATGIDLGKPNIDFLKKQEVLDLLPGIKEIMMEYPEKVKTPIDVAIDINGKRKEVLTSDLPTKYPIFDIGTETILKYCRIIDDAKSIVISGPLGVYENPEFLNGTKYILKAIATTDAFSLVGGGHTVNAVKEFGVGDKMSYISTAGGALIEFLMGKTLPAVATLEREAKRK